MLRPKDPEPAPKQEGTIKPTTVPRLVGDTVAMTVLGLFLALAVENTLWTHAVLSLTRTSGLGIYALLGPMQMILVLAFLGCIYVAMMWGMSGLQGFLPRILAGTGMAILMASATVKIRGDTRPNVSLMVALAYLLGYFLVGDVVVHVMQSSMDERTYEQWAPKLELPEPGAAAWTLLLPQVAWVVALVLFLKYGVVQSLKLKVAPPTLTPTPDSTLVLLSPLMRLAPFLVLIGVLAVAASMFLVEDTVASSVQVGVLICELIVCMILLVGFATMASGATWGPDDMGKTVLMVALATALVILSTTTSYKATSVLTWFFALTGLGFFFYLLASIVETFFTKNGLVRLTWEDKRNRLLSFAIPALVLITVCGYYVSYRAFAS